MSQINKCQCNWNLLSSTTRSSGGHWRGAAHSSAGDTAQRVVVAPIGHVPGAYDHDPDVQDAGLVAAQAPVDPAAHTDADAAELVPRTFHDVSE